MMLAWRLTWREWSSGELRVLGLAMVLAVAIVTSIGTFVERLQNGILNQSQDFLAADLVIESTRPAKPEWLTHAQTMGLQTATILQFQTMVSHVDLARGGLQLASVKAVSDRYPLRGQLQIAPSPTAPRQLVNKVPAPGEAWIDSRLLPLLELQTGDQFQIGETRLQANALVYVEPDRGSGFFSLGPRVLMNIADIEAADVLRPGSQVTYRFLFSGSPQTLAAFRQWLAPQLSANYKWLNLKNSQPTVSGAIDRAETFLVLGGALGVLLACVAAALAAYRYSDRHTRYAALMKSLGATSSTIQRLYMQLLLVVSVLTIVVGWALGWCGQWVFVTIASDMLGSELPSASFQPLLVGAATALACVVCFALPPLWSLKNVPPLKVLRNDIEGRRLSMGVANLAGSAVIILLLFWYSGNVALTASLLIGIAGLALTLLGSAYLLLRSTRLIGMRASSVAGLALSNLRRRGWQNAVHIFIFSLAIMLLLILTLVRTSLIREWQMQLPEGTSNHFLINIRQDEVEPIREWLKSSGTLSQGLYPMIRGRLIAINQTPVLKRMSRGKLHRAGADREMNLSWSEALPSDNRLEAGQWWTAADQGRRAISLEKSLAKNLQVELGDVLTFQLGEELLEAEVTSIRYLQWQSMQPNFYVLFPPGVLDHYASTYITSFYLGRADKLLLNQLISQFPTITLIEIDAIIEQVRTIIAQVSLAIEALLGLILFAGALVLVASVQSSVTDRYQECAILRTLGASRKRVLGSTVMEFACLGLIAGTLAVLGAELSTYFLQTRIFSMTYTVHPQLWWMGPSLGVVLITAVGYISTRRVVDTPPIEVLRNVE